MERARCAEQRLAVDYAFEKCEEERRLTTAVRPPCDSAADSALTYGNWHLHHQNFSCCCPFPRTRHTYPIHISRGSSWYHCERCIVLLVIAVHENYRIAITFVQSLGINSTLVRCISAQILVRVMTTTHGFAYPLRLFQWPWGILYSSRWENRTGF